MSTQAKMSAVNQIGAVAGTGYGMPGVTLGGTYSMGTQHEFDEGIDIRVTPAAGGVIVSVNHRNYNIKPELHIVTEDKDLGAEIGKIITMSYLKKDNNK
jgi:hypothetical protein